MKLYYAPGACSIGIHVLLEEIGKAYQLEPVNLREGAQFKPPFTSVSPKGKVPTLERDDGRVQTFRIVGEDESNPPAGKISYVSPLAQALMGKVVGDTVRAGAGEAEITKIA